jgi:hypothetical protein
MTAKNLSVAHAAGKDAEGKPVYQTSINDHVGGRSWSGESSVSQDQASTEATRKFIGDRRAREYVG